MTRSRVFKSCKNCQKRITASFTSSTISIDHRRTTTTDGITETAICSAILPSPHIRERVTTSGPYTTNLTSDRTKSRELPAQVLESLTSLQINGFTSSDTPTRSPSKSARREESTSTSDGSL